MLPVSWGTIRLTRHVLAAAIARARRPAALAVSGAVTGASALAAVFLGVLLAA
jgi:hypothetical protein